MHIFPNIAEVLSYLDKVQKSANTDQKYISDSKYVEYCYRLSTPKPLSHIQSPKGRYVYLCHYESWSKPYPENTHST